MEYVVLFIIGFFFYKQYSKSKAHAKWNDFNSLVSPDLSDFYKDDSYDDVSSDTKFSIDFSTGEFKVLSSFDVIGLERKTYLKYRIEITGPSCKLLLVDEIHFHKELKTPWVKIETVKDGSIITHNLESAYEKSFDSKEEIISKLEDHCRGREMPDKLMESYIVNRWNKYCSESTSFPEEFKTELYIKKQSLMRFYAQRDEAQALFYS